MLLNYPSNYLCILKKCTWRDLYQALSWLLGTNDKLFLNLQFFSSPVSIQFELGIQAVDGHWQYPLWRRCFVIQAGRVNIQNASIYTHHSDEAIVNKMYLNYSWLCLLLRVYWKALPRELEPSASECFLKTILTQGRCLSGFLLLSLRLKGNWYESAKCSWLLGF